jgi:hypothetical protein
MLSSWIPNSFHNLNGLGAMAAALSGHGMREFTCPRKAVGMAPDIELRNE